MDGDHHAASGAAPSSGRGARHVCGATGELPLALAFGAVQVADEGREALDLIEPNLRCTLGPHRGRHRDLVLDMDREDGAVWTSWRPGERPTGVEVLRNCGAVDGLGLGGDAVCTHFAGHPAEHSWALFDPLLAYIDQHLPGVLRRAATQFLDAAGRARSRPSGLAGR
ncbi:hypothetical protein [Streptomyces sp. PvR034]|uniref:hypothetical protein n=1 Tax=Streptomyces sp. PvR034 TaxID=3156401 RepID=UPI0033909444